MTAAHLISLALTLSMAGLLLAVALGTDLTSLTYLLRRPSLLLRSILAMNVVMPLFALGLALALELDHVVEVALIALALAPVPPILPAKELKAGGARGYTMGLLFVSAALSIVFVPAAAALLGRVFDKPIAVTPREVAGIVATWMLAPLLLGVLIRAVAPRLAVRIGRVLNIAANGVLAVMMVLVLAKVWPAMLALLGNFTLVAIVVFVFVGLLVGHALGGPDPDERTVLALSTATRHPAVALAILHADPDPHAAGAAVLVVLIVGGVASAPYAKWRSRAHAANAAGPLA